MRVPTTFLRRRRPVYLIALVSVALVLLAVFSIVARSGPAPAPVLPTLASPLQPAPTIGGRPPVQGTIGAPGGPYLYDSRGRVVFFHGANVVYKRAPYEVYPDPGKPWNFTAADASLMARLGFNVVRLGVIWAGLEPGTAPANDPAICTRGRPGDPGQLDQSVLQRYLGRLEQTVDLLGRYHIYTIIDMHQDVYNEMFDGEGAPRWAVCTDGVRPKDPPGRWSLEYATPAAGAAYRHFWTNDVVGNLQGQYDQVWGDVAAYFAHNPWILGYDPFNEPFSRSLLTLGDEHFDAQLECFYTGSAHIGTLLHGSKATTCPPNDPANGVIPTILASDPHHLIFDEPDNYASRGYPTFIGPMDFPNLVYNVHIYCGSRSPKTGDPINLGACMRQDVKSLSTRGDDRIEMASPQQPGGPAWFVTEFGASSSPSLLTAFTSAADAQKVGWAYWAWKFYADPTGSANESLLTDTGRLRPTATVLSRTYPEAISGIPLSMSFDVSSAAFHLTYRPLAGARGPTVVFVPTALHYPDGYCARVSGGTVTSRSGNELLQVVNGPGRAADNRVSVTVTAGVCGGS
jgi:endoglycosylceramidase